MGLSRMERLTLWSQYSPGSLQPMERRHGEPEIAILRLDQIRSWASGNKYFKLKYVLQSAILEGRTRIISKGGMFSNHLAALAEACQYFQIECMAIVRSYQPDEQNPSIRQLKTFGAKVVYMKPSAYAAFDEDEAKAIFPEWLFIPEGGLTAEGIRGAAEIMHEIIPYQPTRLVVSGGTMGTVCGILSASPVEIKVSIVPVWKGCTPEYVQDVLTRFGIRPQCAWDLWPEFHFGGFGRYTPELIDYIHQFKLQYGIPLDHVYTAKMMYAMVHKIKSNVFSAEDRVIAIHTGGLQGLQGLEYMRAKTK